MLLVHGYERNSGLWGVGTSEGAGPSQANGGIQRWPVDLAWGIQLISIFLQPSVLIF